MKLTAELFLHCVHYVMLYVCVKLYVVVVYIHIITDYLFVHSDNCYLSILKATNTRDCTCASC